nr:hypothetical protein [Actinomadura madurae]
MPTPSTPSSSAKIAQRAASRASRGARAGDLRLRRGQRRAVELPVDRPGQRVERDERGRDHVLGQRLRQRVPQGRLVHLFGRDVVADQPRVTRTVLPDDDRGLRDARLRGEHGPHLGGLDPETADLDLVVSAA